MSRLELFEVIRRSAQLDKLSIRALAERHGVHRPTVRHTARRVLARLVDEHRME